MLKHMSHSTFIEELSPKQLAFQAALTAFSHLPFFLVSTSYSITLNKKALGRAYPDALTEPHFRVFVFALRWLL